LNFSKWRKSNSCSNQHKYVNWNQLESYKQDFLIENLTQEQEQWTEFQK